MKKTLTTLSVAAFLAAGGIAVAQTATDSGVATGSNATVSNSSDLGTTADSNMNTDTRTLGAGSSDMSASGSTMDNNDTSTLGAGSSDTSLDSNASLDAQSDPVARADRG